MNGASQFLVDHGLSVVFGVVLIEQLGLPVPALPWLLAAGALAAGGKLNAIWGITLTVIACVAADTVWFYLGRKRGPQVLGWLCRISIEPDSCVRRTQNVFTRYGLKGLLAAKFIPGLGTVAPPLAGMARVPINRFLLVDAIGSFMYGGVLIGAGYFFSNQISQIGAAVAHIGCSALCLLLGIVLLYIAGKYWQRQRLLRELRMARITADELRHKLEAGENPLILDLRSRAELDLYPSIIRGAIHVELDKLTSTDYSFPASRDVVVYCSCPNEVTSVRIARLLQKRGLSRIRPLLGGIENWRKLSYPMDTWTATITATGPMEKPGMPAEREIQKPI